VIFSGILTEDFSQLIINGRTIHLRIINMSDFSRTESFAYSE
jgi:hypothetical protein